jgi:hypothetical protein
LVTDLPALWPFVPLWLASACIGWWPVRHGGRTASVAFAESSGIDLPFLWDEGGRAHDAFGFANIPALAVIDREGRVRLKRIGFNAAETGFAEDLRRLLESL